MLTLDVGCGSGTSFWQHPAGATIFGVDIDKAALTEGAKKFPNATFIAAPGERLPFPDNHFDYLNCGVALPYMHIPTALREFRRVVKPGAQLRMTFHPMEMGYDRIVNGLKSLRLLEALFQTYAVLNGYLLGLGIQLRWINGRYESCQTLPIVKRLLSNAQLHIVSLESSPQLRAIVEKPFS